MKQLSVFIENTSGTLVRVLEVIKKAGIQLYAISMADTAEYGICRMICNDTDKAFAELRREGFAASVSNVFAVRISDAPGSASDIVSLFASEEVGIEYLYSFILDGAPVLAFKTDDTDKATDIISSHGLIVAEIQPV